MGVSNYANVYARIRARVGDILEEGRIRELIEARPSEFLPLLMNTAYKEQLTKSGVSTLDARRIEQTLKAELVDQYLMVFRSTKGAIRVVLEEILRRLEVKNLKALIRAEAAAARTGKTGEVLLFPVEEVFERQLSRLIEAKSLADILAHVESPYHEVLEQVFPEYEETRRLLVLEKALDEEILDAIWTKLEKLGRRDEEIVRRIVGTEVDIVNLMTLLRCKAENVAVETMRGYFMPFSYTVEMEADAMQEAVEAENVGAAIRAMPASPYKDVLSRVLPVYESEKSLIPFEDALWRELFSTVRKTLKGYPINIGTIIGFLYLKELEIRNLSTIAVGKENDLPAEEIANLVLGA
jgi:V/A-type H+-transporting ATPase subunit C